jgi:hypothetical protein
LIFYFFKTIIRNFWSVVTRLVSSQDGLCVPTNCHNNSNKTMIRVIILILLGLAAGCITANGATMLNNSNNKVRGHSHIRGKRHPAAAGARPGGAADPGVDTVMHYYHVPGAVTASSTSSKDKESDINVASSKDGSSTEQAESVTTNNNEQTPPPDMGSESAPTPENRRYCKQEAKKHGVIFGQSWGTMLDLTEQQKWITLNCDQYFCATHPLAGTGIYKCERLKESQTDTSR